jgi:hypothetical protein
MSPRSRKEYVEAVFLRYEQAARPRGKVMFDEFCGTLGYHRKHAIRGMKDAHQIMKCSDSPVAALYILRRLASILLQTGQKPRDKFGYFPLSKELSNTSSPTIWRTKRIGCQGGEGAGGTAGGGA